MLYRFNFTANIINSLLSMERIRESMRLISIPIIQKEKLHRSSTLESVFHAVKLNGSRISHGDVSKLISNEIPESIKIRGRENVSGYYQALQQIEYWIASKQIISESKIRNLANILQGEKQKEPVPYRTLEKAINQQSVLRPVYSPPPAETVPSQMKELIHWLQHSWHKYPNQVLAGITHFQLDAIQPFNKNNSSINLLITNWILQSGDYHLDRGYSIESLLENDKLSYFNSLQLNPDFDSYQKRQGLDISPWIEYFLSVLTTGFSDTKTIIADLEKQPILSKHDKLTKKLDQRARKIIGLFAQHEKIQSSQVCQLLGVSQRQARNLLANWVKEGWITPTNTSRKGRKYRLVEEYLTLVEG